MGMMSPSICASSVDSRTAKYLHTRSPPTSKTAMTAAAIHFARGLRFRYPRARMVRGSSVSSTRGTTSKSAINVLPKSHSPIFPPALWRAPALPWPSYRHTYLRSDLLRRLRRPAVIQQLLNCRRHRRGNDRALAPAVVQPAVLNFAPPAPDAMTRQGPGTRFGLPDRCGREGRLTPPGAGQELHPPVAHQPGSCHPRKLAGATRRQPCRLDERRPACS